MAFSLRVGITVVALIAPEIMIYWAMRQWVAARNVSKKYHSMCIIQFLGWNCFQMSIIEYKWTMTHGFFAAMGGFVLLKDGEEPRTLFIDNIEHQQELESCLRNGDIHITEAEIKDRSKSDILAKAFVIIQTGWFLLQCIARRVEHIPVTKLELVTLAFAALNFLTYALWWEKPFSVNCPYRIRVSEREISLECATKEGGENVPNSTVRNHNIPNAINSMVEVLKLIRKTPRAILDGVSALSKIMGQDFEFRERGKKGVPTFYSGQGRDSTYSQATILGASGVAMLFGAIHCIGWSFEYPSHIEKVLWRISSVSITAAPPLCFAGNVIIQTCYSRLNVSHRLQNWLNPILMLSFTVLYVLSRLALFVLALSSLRSLQYGEYQTVEWTTFIPHI